MDADQTPYTPPATPVAPPLPVAPLGVQDAEHLRLLAIFHYVVAGLMVVFSLIFVLYIVMGIAMLNGVMPMDGSNPSSPQEMRVGGWIMLVMGTVIVGGGLSLSALVIHAGRCLGRRQRHTLCLVVAALCCMFTPIGTVLGVFTLVVLLRPQVKRAFAGNASTVA